MKPEDLYLDDSETLAKCPLCNEVSNVIDWESSEVGCEDCGSHAAAKCPKCGESVDLVMNDEFSINP